MTIITAPMTWPARLRTYDSIIALFIQELVSTGGKTSSRDTHNRTGLMLESFFGKVVWNS
jgi:hypothetical protein